MAVSKQLIYRGRVQGVGFRHTTRQTAQGYAVHGFVRNLDDGSVEVVAEGEADQVVAFLRTVESRLRGYIDSSTTSDQLPQGYRGFEIRF